jgi:hypothetical protein
MNILLLSAGNESSIEIIKSLSEESDYQIFGCHWDDISPIYAYMNRSYFRKVPNPFIDESLFISSLNSLIDSESIEGVLVTNCKLIKFVYDHYSEIHRIDKFLLPPFESLPYCLYKNLLYSTFYDITPGMYSMDEVDTEETYFIKPVFGSSSTNSMKVVPNTIKTAHIEDDQIICEYLPGEEVTVDVLCDKIGRLVDFSVRERLQIRDGISSYGRVSNKNRDEIESLLIEMTKSITLPYVWFAQFKRDKSNKFKLLEINSRVSGSFGMTKACNKDYIKEAMNIFRFGTFSDHLALGPLSREVDVARHFNSLAISGKDSYVFDLDGTLCTETNGVFHEAKPITENIEILNKLYNDGHEITIYSARGMKRFNNDVSKVYDSLFQMTKSQLESWGVLYHKLILGKPYGKYIDNDSYTIDSLRREKRWT